MTKKEKYRDALESAIDDLNRAVEERNRLAHEVQTNHQDILSLRQTINALCELIGDEALVRIGDIAGGTPTPRLGLKAACLQMLSYETCQTVHEVMAALEQNGFDLKRYSSAFAAVQTTLSRLSEAEVEEKDGKTAYKLKRIVEGFGSARGSSSALAHATTLIGMAAEHAEKALIDAVCPPGLDQKSMKKFRNEQLLHTVKRLRVREKKESGEE